MLESLSNHAQRECLDAGDSLAAVRPIRHDAGQAWNLGQPTAIDFGLDFDRQRHQSNVASALAVSQATPSNWSRVGQLGDRGGRVRGTVPSAPPRDVDGRARHLLLLVRACYRQWGCGASHPAAHDAAASLSRRFPARVSRTVDG